MLLHQLPGNTQPFGEMFRLVPLGVCVLENNPDHTVFRGIKRVLYTIVDQFGLNSPTRCTGCGYHEKM